MAIEAHFTLAHPHGDDAALAAWLAERGLAVMWIELSHGVSPQQAMITRWAADRDEAMRDAQALRDELIAIGIQISRVKLEEPHIPGAPTGAARYLEHHVKVRITRDDLAGLARIGATHDAHLSRNPRRRVEGGEERFLTQRFAPHDRAAPELGLQALLTALRAAQVPIVKVTRERVIHDDNLDLDAGWRTEL